MMMIEMMMMFSRQKHKLGDEDDECAPLRSISGESRYTHATPGLNTNQEN